MKKNIFILLGGAAGAILRYEIRSVNLLNYTFSFPINTFLINIIGCFMIGIVLTIAYEYLAMDADLHVGLATGFIGAFTTFSTLSKEIFFLIKSGQILMGIFYATASIIIGFLAVYTGVALTRFLFEKQIKELPDKEIFEEEGDELA